MTAVPIGKEFLSTLMPDKPILRGYIHAAALPLALTGCIVLICVAPTWQTKLASSIYLVTSVLLFGVSATYHIGNWSKKIKTLLRRFDHVNIFLIIAGTNTPIAVGALPMSDRVWLLGLVWGAAILSIILHMIWLNVPRVLYVIVYIAIGVAPVLFFGTLLEHGGVGIVALTAGGGVLYITGAVIYALKKPNISKKWYGFHELFHSFTVGGYACHMVAAFLAVMTVAQPVLQ
ncbi:MAG: hemolysin III family protein [Bifidobacteriaceae bacterium]|jgi:hemolysin III|nr:hemolysin III family protein [Bifidobacteriaceae bacterium]